MQVDEWQMSRVRRFLIVFAGVVLFLVIFRLGVVGSQPVGQLQPGFNGALSALQRAEAAGATQGELAPLVDALNKALSLNDQLNQLSAQDSNRSKLQAQISEQLNGVETQAAGLESLASQRVFMDRVVAYVAGGVGALVAALAYAYGTSLWSKYRVKRTFQMRISRK
jgi:hypothetical protein